ncbi:hypothetical protein PSEMO_61770 [Pseudomonas putida]|uniref:Uncharacterized protein n=2 Tax=Pseudomonas putida TaxID=303 RepID=A0A1Q9QUJ1_PSEPU|nr:hypothetical protein PSEMO_61770 [Pseudomonas putida]
MRTKFVRDLSVDEYELYRRHAAIIRKFSKDHELFRLVVRAFEAYERFMKNAVEAVRSNAELNQEALVDYSFEPGALILEFLNTSRIFVDHFRLKIIRAFGECSAELTSHVDLLGSEFDKYFSYRLLYKLRNYTTHCGLPLLHFQLKRVPGEHASLIVTMEPGELLDSFDGWGKIVRGDLESHKNDLYVLPLLRENVGSIHYIFHSLYGELYRDEVLDSLDLRIFGVGLPRNGLCNCGGRARCPRASSDFGVCGCSRDEMPH